MLFKAIRKAIVPALSSVIGRISNRTIIPSTRIAYTTWVRNAARQDMFTDAVALAANDPDTKTSGAAEFWGINDAAVNLSDDNPSVGSWLKNNITVVGDVYTANAASNYIQNNVSIPAPEGPGVTNINLTAVTDITSGSVQTRDNGGSGSFSDEVHIPGMRIGDTVSLRIEHDYVGAGNGATQLRVIVQNLGVGESVRIHGVNTVSSTQASASTPEDSPDTTSFPEDVATHAGAFDGGIPNRSLVVAKMDLTTGVISSEASIAPTTGDFVRAGSSDGNAIYNSAISDNVLTAPGIADFQNQMENELTGARAFPNFLWCWGDSLTTGSGGAYPKALQAHLAADLNPFALDGNKGAGGQTSTEVAARQGGVITELTLTADQINATGTTVVTARSVSLIAPSSTVQFFTGTLLGVRGTLDRIPDDSYEFTRDVDGSAVPCPPGSDFIIDTFRDRSQLSVFWVGRNNIDEAAIITSDVQAMATFLDGSPKEFLVMSVTNGAGEIIGTQAYDDIIAANVSLAAAFPDNYIDVREFLVSNYDPDVPQDVIDFAGDTTPSSLRVDNIHFTDAAYQLVANFAYAHMLLRGYATSDNELLLVDGQPSFTNGEINYI